jgi:hypothetical protein
MKLFFYSIIILLLFIYCNDDSGTGPVKNETPGIEGTITFQGEWPAPAESIIVIISTVFPPLFEELISGGSIPLDVNSYNYSIDLPAGNYKLVGVAWRAENTDWDVLSICGFYFSGEDSLAPGEVTIPDDKTRIHDINIKVNRSKARKVTDSKIVGTVKFNGTWESGIVQAMVIATTKLKLSYPFELPSLLDICFSNPIEPGTDSTDYEIRAFPATFVATGIIFFKENQTLSLQDIIYSSQRGGVDLVNQYVVEEDSTVQGTNFTIQFQ